jgi:N-alpha-acetyl-L-2,4-diaminobutyrate deacetylase
LFTGERLSEALFRAPFADKPNNPHHDVGFIVTRSIGYTDIDFGRNGKQIGFMNLPFSGHDDAWGVLPVPLSVIKNGSGPTVILEGGNHGDEYEGPIVLGEIIRDLDPARLQGRLIIVPAINQPAVQASLRVSPIDGLNFNRTFPGDPLGSVTQQLSSYVNDVLFPLADAFIDLHSGGSSLSIIPSAIVEPSEDPELGRKNREAVFAFDAPLSVVIANFNDPRTSTASAIRAGLITVGTEMAGSGTVSAEAIAICRNGVRNVLQHLGVLERAGAPPSLGGRELYSMEGTAAYLMATQAGIYEPYHALGTPVQAGQPAGRIHFLTDPGRHPGRVMPGNCCCVVASVVEG